MFSKQNLHSIAKLSQSAVPSEFVE